MGNRYRVNPNDTHLAEEFRANPIGHKSPELQRLLNLFRGGDIPGKYCLVCTKPYREWVLARLPANRSERIERLEDYVFTSIQEAEWAVFKLRWRNYSGQQLMLD